MRYYVKQRERRGIVRAASGGRHGFVVTGGSMVGRSIDIDTGGDRFGSAPFRADPAVAAVTPLAVAIRRKWLILAIASLLTMGVGVVLARLPVRFSASASLMVDPRQPRLSSGESLLSNQPVDPDLVASYIAAMQSPSLAREVASQLDLARDRRFCPTARAGSCDGSPDAAAAKLAGAMSFGNDGRSTVIVATAEAPDPKLAASIANTYATLFIARRRDQQAGLTSRADAWLSTHLASLRQTVDLADEAVERQRRDAQLTSLQGQTLLAQSLSEMNAQLTEATAAVSSRRGGVDANDAVLASPILQGLIAREGELAAAQAELATRLGSASPELRASEAQLAGVRAQIRRETGRAQAGARGDLAALEARRSSLAASVADLQEKVGRQGESGMRLEALEGDARSARQRYEEAALRLEQIRLDSALQRSDVQLLVEASPPAAPSFPRIRMMLVGTFMAMLCVGACFAYGLELMARGFSGADRVEDETAAPVLGLFARAGKGRAATTILDAPGSREAESLQATLTGLIGGTLGPRAPRDRRVVMVTSAVPGEGKSSLCVALGLTAMTRGLSVVVLDGDLRRSAMRTLLPSLEPAPVAAAGGKPGTKLTALPAPGDAVFSRMVDQRSGLTVMAAAAGREATATPYALLAAAELPAAFEQLRETYDLVLIDTPPVLAVSDAVSLSALADSLVLVVEWRRTRRADVAAALKMLRGAKVSVAGVVLSKVDLRRYARLNGGADDARLRAYEGWPRAGQAA